MIELILLGVGFAILGWYIPVKSAPKRYDGTPTVLFDKNREGWAQPTRDEQKRRNPVVQRAQGNAYNDEPLKVVSRNSSNEVFTDAFRQRYIEMLNKNRMRPSTLLTKHWQSTSSHMQQSVGNGYIGKATAQSTLNTTLPYEFTSNYVPSLWAGALSGYKK
jgi:uncharacterized protein affecting Mg2+/Co2+ transport